MLLTLNVQKNCYQKTDTCMKLNFIEVFSSGELNEFIELLIILTTSFCSIG